MFGLPKGLVLLKRWIEANFALVWNLWSIAIFNRMFSLFLKLWRL
jgi:hypothetical protein